MAKVSVCIPTYNYGHFIGEAVASVLRQSLQDFEIIITDNASQDDTEQIVAQLCEGEPRIRYLRNAENLGMVANWNRCLDLATGEYVKYLCADDILQPECLKQLAGLLDAHQEASLVASARGVISDGTTTSYLSYSDKPEVVPGPECIRRMLIGGNLVGEPTAVMFRRSAARRGFRSDLQQLTDMEFWCHLLEQGAFAFTPDLLCLYRQHEGMETKKNMRSLRIYTEGRAIYRTYGRSAGVRLGSAERLFCSMRPLLAFLYCWLYARFSRSNSHVGAKKTLNQHTTKG